MLPSQLLLIIAITVQKRTDRFRIHIDSETVKKNLDGVEHCYLQRWGSGIRHKIMTADEGGHELSVSRTRAHGNPPHTTTPEQLRVLLHL